MTEDSYYSTLPLSVAITTAESRTSRTRTLPSTPDVVDFYFLCGVIVIGVIGTVANALVLYALVVSGQHK